MSQTFIDPAGQPVGRAGQLADNGPKDVLSGVNNEASAGIPFGVAVKVDVTDDSGRGYLNLAANSDKVNGITLYAYAHQPGTTGDIDTDGNLKPGAMLDILNQGRVLVVVEEAVSVGDRAYVRAVASGSEVLGAFRKSADASDTIDITKNAIFRTAAGIGGLAVVEVDFTIKS